MGQSSFGERNKNDKPSNARKAKRAVRVLGVASLLLGVLTLVTGEFSMGRYRSIATGTTAVVIGSSVYFLFGCTIF